MQTNEQPLRNLQAKLVILGNSDVGKSCLVLKFVNNEFQENTKATIGAAFFKQKCCLEDGEIKFQIWDTSGLERFRSLTPMYYRNAQAAIVVYDVTRASSLNEAKSWVEVVRRANPNILIALVGNKIDLVQSIGERMRQVPTEEAKGYAYEAGLLFFETSAKTGDGILDVFTKIATRLLEPKNLEPKTKKNTKIIWVKFNENPVKIVFNGKDVFDLIEGAKTKLDGLDNFKMDLIEVYKHNSEESLEFGQIVDDSFINQYETPIEIRAKRKGDYHDMIIKVGDDVFGHEFKVHSQILGAQTTYFRSALLNDQCMKKDGRFYFVKPNITFEAFQIILRFIYGGTVSLDEQDTSDTLKVLAAADELLLQELVDYLQVYLIENKTEWIEQHFELIHQMSFNSNSLLKLQNHCIDFMSKSPEKIFKSFDFTSLPEKSLISLIKRDDLQMKEIEIWEYVIKWGLEKNPTLIPDPTMWSDNDFKIMKKTLEHCLPLIRFFSFSSEDFLQEVHPYKKLLNHQLYEDLLKSYLDPNSEPDESILLPRYKNIDGIIDSKIVNLNIISIISIWIDKIDINSRFSYTRELYLPYKFKLLLRGSRDGFTPEKFHTLCDDTPYTVTFIKVKGTEEILGGYNPLRWKSWKSYESYGQTKDSFIFSFKNFRDSILSHVKNVDQALYYHDNWGPSFDSDLNIGVSGNDNSREYDINVCRPQSYVKKIRETEDNFMIEDYEVFQTIMKKE